MSFTFTLEHGDGSPPSSQRSSTAVPNWNLGDTIPLGNDRALRAVGIRDGATPDDDAVLIVKAA